MYMKKNHENTKNTAQKIRELALKMRHDSGAYHIGGDLSVVDILAVLYDSFLRFAPENPFWEERDRFILSKGHSCAPLYALLAIKKFFPIEELATFYQNGGKLAGHVTHNVPGIEASTGSLGHGLPIGCGMAFAAKRQKKDWRVIVVLSDGEMDEGSNWESILFAGHHGLDNLLAIIDYNKIQSLGATKEILDLDPLTDKLRSFGWGVKEVNGNDVEELSDALASFPFAKGKPSMIIAHTIKGKGVSFMEESVHWHYRRPNDEQLAQALKEIYEN